MDFSETVSIASILPSGGPIRGTPETYKLII